MKKIFTSIGHSIAVFSMTFGSFATPIIWIAYIFKSKVEQWEIFIPIGWSLIVGIGWLLVIFVDEDAKDYIVGHDKKCPNCGNWLKNSSHATCEGERTFWVYYNYCTVCGYKSGVETSNIS